MRQRVQTDLADIQTDEDPARTSDSPFARAGECPTPAPCAFTKFGICTVCGKKDAPHEETRMLIELAKAMDGGLPIAADELSVDQWVALGEIRAERRAKQSLMGVLGG